MRIKNVHKLQEGLIAENQRAAAGLTVGSEERVELENHINDMLESAQKGKQDVERGKRQKLSIAGQIGYAAIVALCTAAGVLIPRGVEQWKADRMKANE